VNTYLFGYGGAKLSVADMETRQTWVMLHPEFRRRLLALFDEGRSVGVDVGIGEGWRSSEQQARTFYQRHVEVASGGCCRFNGKRFQLRAGMAHAAPPFGSFHETVGMPDGLWALAADLVGDLAWAQTAAARHDLIHFARVNNEPWHFQPKELPVSRFNYNGQKLNEVEVDMIALDYQPNSPSWVATLWTGDTLAWIVDGHADQVLRSGGVRRVAVTKEQFAGVIRSSRTISDPPAGLSTDLQNLWKAQRM
jgi:hypothetical protein